MPAGLSKTRSASADMPMRSSSALKRVMRTSNSVTARPCSRRRAASRSERTRRFNKRSAFMDCHSSGSRNSFSWGLDSAIVPSIFSFGKKVYPEEERS